MVRFMLHDRTQGLRSSDEPRPHSLGCKMKTQSCDYLCIKWQKNVQVLKSVIGAMAETDKEKTPQKQTVPEPSWSSMRIYPYIRYISASRGHTGPPLQQRKGLSSSCVVIGEVGNRQHGHHPTPDSLTLEQGIYIETLDTQCLKKAGQAE